MSMYMVKCLKVLVLRGKIEKACLMSIRIHLSKKKKIVVNKPLMTQKINFLSTFYGWSVTPCRSAKLM